MTALAQAIHTTRWGDNEMTNRAVRETLRVNHPTGDRKFLQVIAMRQAIFRGFGWQAMQAINQAGECERRRGLLLKISGNN